MTELPKAKIFLSEERGLDDGNGYRSCSTFNFGNFCNENKTPFGNLYVLNDDSLVGGQSLRMKLEESTFVMLLPIVGAINYKDSLGNDSLINSGELQMINLPGGTDFELLNPYENDPVNFLQFWIRSGSAKIDARPLLSSFNLVENKNSLIEIAGLPSYPKCTIGQFRGREEAIYEMENDEDGLFVFIIEGAFEVEGRLLHPRDGLALWGVEKWVALEALSNEAIILILALT